MLSLTSIAGWEEAVLASIAGARGAPEERDRQVERSGMYAEYPAIASAYVELFAAEDARLEALKRALFLVWRGAMAPPWESGIAPLPDGVVRHVIEELDSCVREERFDEELEWMLAWYHGQAPFVLELFAAAARTIRTAEAVPADRWKSRLGPGERAGMSMRGQMGRYWASLAGAPE